MKSLCFAALGLLLAGSPCAQSNLSELQRRFTEEQAELRAKSDGPVSFQAHRELATRHAKELAAWLDGGSASALDGVNGRLLLANIYMEIRQPDDARGALKALDVSAAPAMELAVAAMLGSYLGMAEERAAWIRAAIDKPTPFEERMALAVFLATRLEELDKAQAIFAAAEAEAADDEALARVGWFRAEMTREREDLEDGAYAAALAQLASKFPNTYWGGVAKDRRRALDLRVGADAIDCGGETLTGETVRLEDLRGKVVLLDFWHADALDGAPSAGVLRELHETFADRGLQILGVNLDTDRERARAAARDAGYTWPHLFDGRGFRTDAALRYAVEQAPHHLLIGRDGKVAALRLFLRDSAGVQELREAIEIALQRD